MSKYEYPDDLMLLDRIDEIAGRAYDDLQEIYLTCKKHKRFKKDVGLVKAMNLAVHRAAVVQEHVKEIYGVMKDELTPRR